MSKKKKKQKNNKDSLVEETLSKSINKELYFQWDVSKLTLNFPENIIENLNTKLLINNIIPALQKCVGKTWAKIINHPDNYFLNIPKSSKSLYENWINNLKEEQKDFATETFCFSIGDKKWLLGIKQGAIFKVLWYDEGNHSYLPKQFRREEKYFEWDISTIEWEYPNDANEKLNEQNIINEITSKLQQHELQKWGTMCTHPKHHFLNIKKSSNPTPFKIWKQHERFKQVGEELFSFSLGSRKRLYGYVIGVTFHALWYDHNHVIFPSKIRNT